MRQNSDWLRSAGAAQETRRRLGCEALEERELMSV